MNDGIEPGLEVDAFTEAVGTDQDGLLGLPELLHPLLPV